MNRGPVLRRTSSTAYWSSNEYGDATDLVAQAQKKTWRYARPFRCFNLLPDPRLSRWLMNARRISRLSVTHQRCERLKVTREGE